MAGTNVVIPNPSPLEVREKYMLYDNKISTGVEVTANIEELKNRMVSIGYGVVTDRDGHKKVKSSPCLQGLIVTLKATLSANSSILQILRLRVVKKTDDRK